MGRHHVGDRALQRLQFALLPECHLFLGSSESLGGQQRNFAVVHMRHRLFRLIHREPLKPGLTAGRMPSLVKRDGAAAVPGADLRRVVGPPLTARN